MLGQELVPLWSSTGWTAVRTGCELLCISILTHFGLADPIHAQQAHTVFVGVLLEFGGLSGASKKC